MSSKVWRGSAASIRQMSRQVSRGSAGEYQEDEQAGVAQLSWRVSCMVGFWGEPSSGLQTADFLLHLHIVERGQEVL